MPSTQAEDRLIWLGRKLGSAGKGNGRVPVLACLLVLILTTVAWSQRGYEQEGSEGIQKVRSEQFDKMTEALQRYGKICLKVGAVILGLLFLKIINPINLYYNAGDRALRRAVRNVEDLLKKIREEAETASADTETETEEEEDLSLEGGLLGGMTELVEMASGDDVPAYVLTVNDLALDDVRITLKRLRRFRDGSADKYKNSMFSVITGIKMITEQSAAAGVGSGLAVNIKEYFGDEHRHHAWKKTLAPYAKRGDYQEPAQGFLLFMKNLASEKPMAAAQPTPAAPEPIPLAPLEDTAVEIPGAVNEDTLPQVQRAAIEEARRLCTQVRKNEQLTGEKSWQFEFVDRQEQAHLRKESQKMFMVFLNFERKVLQMLTKSKMLPCRTWEHILHVLGVTSGDQLQARIDNKLLTVQEIAILEKAFLQTFAKQASLQLVYGKGQGAGVMIDLHIPQIRREALDSLRRLHQSQPEQLDKATAGLNQEETPQHNEVTRLVQHYIYRRHNPPGLS